jgi:hypothetical protein
LKLETAFITRFHYPLDHPDFKWRFNYYKEQVLPRLQNQTIPVQIWVWCEPHHEHLFKELGVNTFQATYTPEKVKHFTDFTSYKNTIGLPMFDVQIGIDSDDLAYPDLAEKALEEIKSSGKEKVLLSFQPLKFDLKTKRKYVMPNYQKKNRCSPCYAIKQPKDINSYKFIYYRCHYRMNTDLFFDQVIHVNNTYVMMTIHDLNDTTKIKPTDQLIK